MRWLLPLALLAAFGCDRGPGVYKPTPRVIPPPIATINGPELMPLKDGTVWTYSVESSVQLRGKNREENSSELLFAVTGVKAVPGGKTATIQVYRDDEKTDEQRWLVTDKGIYQLSIGLKQAVYDPPQLILPFPVKVGQKFSYNGKGICSNGKLGQIRSRSTVTPSQAVDTDMGLLQAVGVSSEGQFQSQTGPGAVKSTTYFKPGTGIVRLRQIVAVPNGTVTTSLKLKQVKVLG